MAGIQTQSAVRQANSSLINQTQSRQKKEDSLGKQDFLNLMMTQMTHQDPLNPMDSQGMMQQLSQMGSVEQLMNLNKGVSQLNTTQADVARSTAFSFVDKDVSIRGGKAQVISGHSPDLSYRLDREATDVKMFITTNKGGAVRTLNLGLQKAGSHGAKWDGLNAQGEKVDDGTYKYLVVAKTPEGEKVPVELMTRGKVSGVMFDGGRAKLQVNGQVVDLSDVMEVSSESARLFGLAEPKGLREALRPKPLAGLDDL